LVKFEGLRIGETRVAVEDWIDIKRQLTHSG
jgi:hypothetical protein